MRLLFGIVILAALAGCATTDQKSADDKAALVIKPASFANLQGWAQEDFKGFMQAYRISCARILKRNASDRFSANPAFGTYDDWQKACKESDAVNAQDSVAVRRFLENNFKVVQATANGEEEGLFTGYYESTLNGAKTKGGAYQHPLLARPDDLVMVDLGEFRDELKGQRIAGRVKDGKLKPYEDRASIVSGKLPAQHFKPLVWLDSAEDAFFVQVQGSGIVHLNDGGIMRVGYAGQNGHPYYAIGRELVKRGIYKKEDVSMESIRRWLSENPAQADELMNTNRSYVFFEESKGAGDTAGPKGGEGVALTAGRSIAIDHSKLPYGFPLYLQADYADESGKPIRRLMMAQDTGGAIRGAVRGDYFWGAGTQAEKMAGPMKAKGRYYFLIPKSIQ